jgi:sugar porter (SP) family MFS transporter
VSLSAIAECVYLSEIAPPSRRGQLVSLNELGITIGIMLAYAVNFALIDTRGGWRVMFAVAGVPALIQLVGMARLPQSPRWLLMRGRRDDALAALRQFRVVDDVMREPLMPSDSDGAPQGRIELELAAMEAAISSQGQTRLLDLVRVPVLRKALWIGCVLVLLQQLTGQPSILSYGTILLHQAGFQTRRQASLANLAIGALKAAATVAAILTVDKLGRRKLLLIGTTVMTLSLLILASVLTVYGPSPGSDGGNASGVNTTAGEDPSASTAGSADVDADAMSDEVKWATLASLTAYVCAYSFSYGPVVWLILSETFPDDIRARALAVATLLNYGANFAVSMSFLSLLAIIGIGGLCLVYASVGVVAGIFIASSVPETRGASLEEVQAILLRAPPTCCPGGRHRYATIDSTDDEHD